MVAGTTASEENGEGSNKPDSTNERTDKMKKLMIVAAVAAMVGAAKADSTCVDPGGVTPGCTVQTLVYQWQFKGKTGAGVIINATKQTKESGGTCVDPVITPGTFEVIRVPGSLALVGYSYLCDAECYTIQTGLMNPTKAQYYATKPLKSLITPYRGQNFIKTVDVANVIGKSKSQYELAGEAEFNFPANDIGQVYKLRFAGFGSYDKKNQRVSSVSGSFAGTQTVPRYPKAYNGVRCPAAGYWDCCSLLYANGSEGADSVAYGNWSMKYNAAASKQLSKNKSGYWVK